MSPGQETSRTQSCLKHLRPGSERPLRLRTRQPSAITPITYVPVGDARAIAGSLAVLSTRSRGRWTHRTTRTATVSYTGPYCDAVSEWVVLDRSGKTRAGGRARHGAMSGPSTARASASTGLRVGVGVPGARSTAARPWSAMTQGFAVDVGMRVVGTDDLHGPSTLPIASRP